MTEEKQHRDESSYRGKICKCLLCDGILHYVLLLKPTPLANELLLEKEEQFSFPLNLMKCSSCSHLQLDYMVNPKKLYQHYLYCSDTSASNREYFKSYAEDMIKQFDPKKVLDIASNDGLFLSYFKERGIKVCGVDPAQNIAHAACEKGIDTYPEFFDETLAGQMLCTRGKFDLITCNNAFAHNADLRPIVKGVEILLEDNGSFVFEVSYAMRLLEKGLFDLIYHEHMHHHHIKPLYDFLDKLGLRIYDAEERPTHGGSIRIYACKKESPLQPSDECRDLMFKEGKNFERLVSEFPIKIENNRGDLIALMEGIKSEGKTISILGFPAKATTLAYYFETDHTIIDDVFDDNVLKQGRWTPGGEWKVRPTSDIRERKPDYLLILAWNYADALIKTHRETVKGWGGKFIIPLPEMKVVE
jgi:SAM-dependent methyltransferase